MSAELRFDAPVDATIVRGAIELEKGARGVVIHRLPAWARARCADPQLAMVEAQPAGVRLVFSTEARSIALELARSRAVFAGVPPRPDGVVELVVDARVVAEQRLQGGTTRVVDMSTGSVDVQTGATSVARFDGLAAGRKHVELWLPHNETIEIVSLRADAAIAPLPRSHSRMPVWVHHGSSISHGSNAERPTGTWPVVAARASDVDIVNLGFGGSALLDPFTARTIRDLPADLISVKIGINLVNSDLMRMRAFGQAVHGFLDTIRDGHPTTPLLVVSPIFCGIHERTPGPGAFDLDALADGVLRFRATGDPAAAAAGALTLETIRAELARVVSQRRQTDTNLHHLDGLELYGPADALVHPLPDALHPDSSTQRLIGERFADLVFGPGGAFADR